MNKSLFKKLTIATVGTIGAIYGLFLLAPFIVSPIVNSYAPMVSDEIQKATGLTSVLEEFRLVTTPKLTVGVKVGKFALLTPNK